MTSFIICPSIFVLILKILFTSKGIMSGLRQNLGYVTINQLVDIRRCMALSLSLSLSLSLYIYIYIYIYMYVCVCHNGPVYILLARLNYHPYYYVKIMHFYYIMLVYSTVCVYTSKWTSYINRWTSHWSYSQLFPNFKQSFLPVFTMISFSNPSPLFL